MIPLCLVCLILFLLTVGADARIRHHSPQPSSTPGPAALFDNLGNHHHPITTSSPLAQRYFDQGLRLVYAFNHDEAIRSFEEATRLDPHCSMAYWGIALALGPNINSSILELEQELEAYRAIQQALSLLPHTTQRERAYIKALATRYSGEPAAHRKVFRSKYVRAMRDLTRRFPDDLDAATLFAEALLTERPWDHWTFDGKPQPGTLEILSTLERVLRQNPSHPGANHFYIHALEASPFPRRALPSAERIAELMPGAGHLVHMSSHIYMRVGRYADAVESNKHALVVDMEYIEKSSPSGVYPMMMVPHNLYFLWAALAMEGRSAEAFSAARSLVAAFPEEMMRQMPMVEFFAPVPLFTLARFGKWEEILKEPRPSEDFQYLIGMWHYARGLAFAGKEKQAEAHAEKDKLISIANALHAAATPGQNLPARLLRLASSVLSGELAAKEMRFEKAIFLLREAVRLQDQLPYYEPPPWYYPVRQSLGAVLLAANRTAEAEAVYNEDLEKNPENGWSLFGLAQSLRAQNKPSMPTEKRFQKAWKRSDLTLTASRF